MQDGVTSKHDTGVLRSDTFAGFDDNAGDFLGDHVILLIDVQDRDGPGSGRRTAASETLVVEYL